MFSKHQKYRKYNYISMLLEYEEEIWKKKQPTKCRCPNCKGKPGRFKLHEKRVRKILIETDEILEKTTRLLRWKCPLCNKTWTEYPWFIEANKRYLKPIIVLKALEYISIGNSTYRGLTSLEKMPIWYNGDEDPDNARSQSHTTLHRWVGWLGDFEIEVFRYMDWLYQQKPEVEIHRREILISRHKYRSERRLSILEVVKRWSLIAAELVEEKLEKIFLQFAPHVGEKTARLFS